MDTSGQPSLGVLIATALIAVALQLIVAPAATIYGVVPNFILIIVVINAIKNNPVRSTITGFLLGLVFDFCSLGPIGAMTLVLTILSFAVSSLNKGIFSGGLVVDMVIMLFAIIFGEFLTSVIYAVVGVNPDFLLSLLQRVLPAIAYDALLGLFFLFIYNAVVKDGPSKPGGGRFSGGGTGRSLTRKLHM